MVLYKNWPEICKIGRRDKLLMLVLASVALNEDDDILQGLYVGFPQCFSTGKIDGPFPLSVIRELAAEEGRAHGRTDGELRPDNYGVLSSLCIPSMPFALTEEAMLDTGWPFLSPDVTVTLKQGDVCKWKEKRLVVLEKNSTWMCVVPAECIALDQ